MNEWREITQLNVETIKELNKRGHPVALANKEGSLIRYRLKQKDMENLDKYAMSGGVYYLTLPKLY